MQPKTIRITVKEDGSYTTDFSNFSGADCLTAGKQIHTLLAQFGVQPEQTAMTPKPELLAAEGLLQELNAEFDAHQEAHVEG